MQTYNYKCNDCGKSFEVKATLKEKESKKFSCTHCKSKNTKYQFSLTNFIKNTFSKEGSSDDCCSGDDNSCDIKCNPNNNKCTPTDSKGGCC